MIDFVAQWSEKTLEQLTRLTAFRSGWDRMLALDVKEIAEAAVEHMKPMTSVRPNHTGEFERSITYITHQTGGGYTVDFYGLFYGNYVDTGSPFDVMFASDYTANGWAFNVDSRFPSDAHWSGAVAGVGKGSQYGAGAGLPTHFTEKTAKWLAENYALDVSLKNMSEWLNEVVA